MLKPLELSGDIGPLVSFVEETGADRIVEATLEKLRGGTPPLSMLTASALAVSRSSELPADHHGGPVHPVSGIHGVCRLAGRLAGDARHLPVIQNVALANKHLHDVETGPTSMLAIAPLEAGDGGPDATALAFVAALKARKPLAAERYFLALLPHRTPGEILDLILTVAIPRAALDEHHFNYPIFAVMALDDIGWEWASVILRPPVRYVASHPALYGAHGCPDHYVDELLRNFNDFSTIERLIEDHRLLEIDIPMESGEHETAAVGDLGERIGSPDNYKDIPRLVAEALAGGLSLEGAGEALSIGAATLNLRCNHVAPDEVHMHTAINARRYLLKLDGISLRTRLLALLSWNRDPEIHFANVDVRFVPGRTPFSPRADAATIAALPGRSQDALLDAIADSIAALPIISSGRDGLVGIDDLIDWPPIQHVAALAQQYSELGYDPAAFFVRIGELACQDDVSEMHGYKFQQAAYEEYYATREPYRLVHLLSAVRHVACIFGVRPKPIHDRVAQALAA